MANSDKNLPPVTDGFEFMKRMWSGFSLPPGFAPTMSIEDIDKRISDLKAVEQWMNLNLSMLRTTIQGMEVQRGTLAMLQSYVPPDLSKATAGHKEASKSKPSSKAAGQADPKGESAGASQAAQAANDMAQLMVNNAQAWWSSFQEQMAATGQGMDSSAGQQGGDAQGASSTTASHADKSSTESADAKYPAGKRKAPRSDDAAGGH